MFDRDIRPKLQAASGGAVIFRHSLRTFGAPEAEIGEKLADFMERGRNPAVGMGTADLITSVRINARGAKEDEARRLLAVAAACSSAEAIGVLSLGRTLASGARFLWCETGGLNGDPSLIYSPRLPLLSWTLLLTDAAS